MIFTVAWDRKCHRTLPPVVRNTLEKCPFWVNYPFEMGLFCFYYLIRVSVTIQPLSASSLSWLVTRSASVCFSPCVRSQTSALRRERRGGVIRRGPILCILFESPSVRRGGDYRAGREGGREGRTAAIAGMRSETRVMRNLTSAVCRSPTQRPSSRRRALNSVKNGWR